MSGDVERLAKVIHRVPGVECSHVADVQRSCERDARAILASDWLAERDRKMQAAGAALNVLAHGSQHPDMETYARIHNEGWDAAMVAQVAPDPTTADDWLAAHDAEVAARALREAADAWTQGGWSDVMLPKPSPPAVPVIAYSNRIADWLRARADRVAGHAQEDA